MCIKMRHCTLGVRLFWESWHVWGTFIHCTRSYYGALMGLVVPKLRAARKVCGGTWVHSSSGAHVIRCSLGVYDAHSSLGTTLYLGTQLARCTCCALLFESQMHGGTWVCSSSGAHVVRCSLDMHMVEECSHLLLRKISSSLPQLAHMSDKNCINFIKYFFYS